MGRPAGSSAAENGHGGNYSPRVRRVALTMREPPLYSASVEIFARSGPGRTGIKASASSLAPLARVTQLVQPQLDQVQERIIKQATAFDPAIEGYVSYAIGGHGKRLRPLVALLAGGATGQINTGHVDLAVIVELIHAATLVHDDIMDEAQRRRCPPTGNGRGGNS